MKSGEILIIDDDADDRDLMKEIIQELDVNNRVRFFENGKEALDYLVVMQEQPFIILCDVNMPLMNGIELRQRINENEVLHKKSIPFVFFTTAATEDAVSKAYEMSVQGYFQKPVDYKQMRRLLELTLEYWFQCKHPNNLRTY